MFLVAAFFSGEAHADNRPICIPKEVRETIEACPAGLTAEASRRRNSGRPASHLKGQERRERVEPRPPKAGPEIRIKAGDLFGHDPSRRRSAVLLKKELAVARRLVENALPSDPRRPDYILRLSRILLEMALQQNAVVRGLDQPIFETCKTQRDESRCSRLKNEQGRAQDRLDRLRASHIRTLAQFVRDHPGYRRIDEVLFSLGYSLEELRQFDRARHVYHRLIKEHPASAYIPHAYLSFAEYYFQQGDMRAAGLFYEKIVQIPPDANRVYGYALYKQAWCRYNLEEYQEALESFVRVIEFGAAHPDAFNVSNLVGQARKEMVLAYAQVGIPARAFRFFSRYASDNKQALGMLENLGRLYEGTGRWPQAVAVYHDLMRRKPDSLRLCEWQARVTAAVVASRPKPEQLVEAQRLADIAEKTRQNQSEASPTRSCREAAASALIDLATAWHREAVGTDTQPGTNDEETMKLSARLYRLLLQQFPDLDRLRFPDIDRRHRTTRYRATYFMAELLWKMEAWDECAEAFDRVVEIEPRGAFSRDAAYAAVLCYNNVYRTTYRKDRKRLGAASADDCDNQNCPQHAPRELADTEKKMLAAFRRYLCVSPRGEHVAHIKYRRAYIHYEARHFEEAAVLFRDVAFNHRDDEVAPYAANLYLDSLNALGSRGSARNPACFEELRTSIDPLDRSFCASDDREDEDQGGLCDVLARLRCEMMRKNAEERQANQQWKSAAKIYMTIARKYPNCGRLDEVLFNAAICFEADHLLGRAIKTRTVLVEKYPNSPLAPKAVYLVGANFHALAMYDRAAEYYEIFAGKYPRQTGKDCPAKDRELGLCAGAHEALQNAVFFRLGLGDEKKAIEDAALFEKHFAARYPRDASRVKYALGSIYRRSGQWQRVAEHYRGFLDRYGSRAMPHEVIQANVEIGRAYLSLGRKSRALPFFRAASDAWFRGAADRIAKLEETKEQKERFAALARTATAEALFHQANDAYDAFMAIEFPSFRAKGRYRARRTALFQQWLNRDFARWMQRKLSAMDGTRITYDRVATLSVPGWSIAAAARVGDVYLSFVNEFREAPVPPWLEGDEELVALYFEKLDETSQHWVVQATDAYRYCLSTATKLRWFNEYSTHCETELSRLDPATYPRAAELRGDADFFYTAWAIPGAVPGTDEEGR